MTDPVQRMILHLLAERAPTSSICPSDAARALDPTNWRRLMPPVREAAAELAAAGEVEVTQGGQVVDGRTVRGPVRIRRPPGSQV